MVPGRLTMSQCMVPDPPSTWQVQTGGDELMFKKEDTMLGCKEVDLEGINVRYRSKYDQIHYEILKAPNKIILKP